MPAATPATDHVKVLDRAIAALQAHARPRPGEVDGPSLLANADFLGATRRLAAALRTRGIGFSLALSVDDKVQRAILAIPDTA
jgi:hypothetical protein